MIANKATFTRWLTDAGLPEAEAKRLLQEYQRGGECAQQACDIVKRKLTGSHQKKPAPVQNTL